MYLFEAVESELLRNNLREIGQWLSGSNLSIYPVASPDPPKRKQTNGEEGKQSKKRKTKQNGVAKNMKFEDGAYLQGYWFHTSWSWPRN